MKIQKIQALHYTDYVKLIGSQLGEGYLTEADFVALAANPKAPCFEAVDSEGKPLGVITSLILPKQEAIERLKIEPKNLPDYAENVAEIAIFKTIAIHKNSQGKGIGSMLTQHLIQYCQNQQISVMACVAWQYGETENIRGVMKAFDFKCYQQIPNYWIEDTDFICPVCQQPPCYCQANIYFKQI